MITFAAPKGDKSYSECNFSNEIEKLDGWLIVQTEIEAKLRRAAQKFFKKISYNVATLRDQ